MDFRTQQNLTKIDLLVVSDKNNITTTKITHDSPSVLISGNFMIISTTNNDESITTNIYDLNLIKKFKTYNK